MIQQSCTSGSMQGRLKPSHTRCNASRHVQAKAFPNQACGTGHQPEAGSPRTDALAIFHVCSPVTDTRPLLMQKSLNTCLQEERATLQNVISHMLQDGWQSPCAADSPICINLDIAARPCLISACSAWGRQALPARGHGSCESTNGLPACAWSWGMPMLLVHAV